MQPSKEIILNLSDMTLHGLAWGNPSNPLILAIHGWLDNAGSFAALAQKLPGYYFVALDMPGQGKSLLPLDEATPSFHRMAKLIPEALNMLTDKPAILMAHSIGTGFATYIAAHASDKISKVVLLDGLGVLSKELSESPSTLADMYKTFVSTENLPIRSYKTLEDMLKFRSRITGLSVEGIRPIVERGSKKMDTGHQWTVDPRLSLAALADFSEEEALNFLRKAKVPILLIIGNKRRLIPLGNELIENRIKAVKDLTIVNLDAGHHLHISHADDAAKSILEILNGPNF